MATFSKADDSWLTAVKSGLVPIDAHSSLYLSASGPPRLPPQPIVIIEAGLASTSAGWVAVQHLIASFARVYSYDRLGYGRSSAIPSPNISDTKSKVTYSASAKQKCLELTSLLEHAGIEPPRVLVGHSYGGLLVREFLLMHGSEKVAGLVIVDSAIAKPEIPDDWESLIGSVNYYDVTGLSELRKGILSDEEWDSFQADDKEVQATTDMELEAMDESYAAVNEELDSVERRGGFPMGKGRLSVVFCDFSADFEKILAFADEEGNGTQKMREKFGDYLKTLRAEQREGQRKHLRTCGPEK